MNEVTIIMYHYVRDLKHSKYPKINGLDLPLFVEQIEYIKKNYNVVTMESVIKAFDEGSQLPPKSALLTFDDAYSDHYNYVFPILDERHIQGSFFPPVKALTDHTVLDVNKIHFILAAVENKNILIDDILSQLKVYRDEYNLESDLYYLEKLSIANRFDKKEVIFIKRLLQVELKEELRKLITNYLFNKYVSKNEETFSRDLYMSIDQIKCMKRNGMHIGCHGYDHYWLGSLSKAKQVEEINKSLDFIRDIGGDETNWTMCYPYGNYDQNTIDILKDKGCKLGLTTEVDIAVTKIHNQYELPRLDTNDIPKDRYETPNGWYIKAY